LVKGLVRISYKFKAFAWVKEEFCDEGLIERLARGLYARRVYSPARTVADCFKFRNQIGLDVAIEALRDTRNQGKATVDELLKYAEICRVKNVLRPYLEAML